MFNTLRVKPNLSHAAREKFYNIVKVCCDGEPVFTSSDDMELSHSLRMRVGLLDEDWDELLARMDECMEQIHKPMLEI